MPAALGDTSGAKGWVQILVARSLAEGETAFESRSRRPHTSPQRTSQATEDAIVALRKDLAGPAWMLARRRSPGTCATRRAPRRRWPPSGGSCPGAGSSPRSRISGPGPPGTGSQRTCPASCGRPTSPTGRWPAAATPRSSISSTITPGCWPGPPPGAFFKAGDIVADLHLAMTAHAGPSGCLPIMVLSSPAFTAAVARSPWNDGARGLEPLTPCLQNPPGRPVPSVASAGLSGRSHEIRQHPGSLVSDVGVTGPVSGPSDP